MAEQQTNGGATAGTTGGATGGAKVDGEGKSRYRATLNLPKTSFAMKANLVQNEPMSLKRWQGLGLYEKVRQARAGAEKFVFHDGPPYANGGIHLGHLMNKCFKDFVVRSRTMEGKDCAYVPGWDCHGLPIEHKVMTEMVAAGKAKKLEELDEWGRRMAVRRECAKHAEKYIKLQSGQMQRLLTLADYANPYLTMAKEYEAGVLEVLARLLERGLVYRALKPVHWSIANETALAEAELEYQDREDVSVYVDFETVDADAVYAAFGLVESMDDDAGEDDDAEAQSDGVKDGDGKDEADGGGGAKRLGIMPGVRPHARPSLMIWTTTPWTLPANLAIAVNPALEYALVWVDGNVTVMAAEAVERVTQKGRSEEVVVLARALGEKLVGLRYRHPFVKEGEGAVAKAADGASTHGHAVRPEAIFTVVGADYVTLEDGTGLVHTAPGHGTEDYQTGLRVGLPVYCPVRGDGTYDQSVPTWLRGMSIWEANAKVVEHLRSSGHLFHDHTFMHSYPHDWRSKTPVIFRCTEQWFVSVDDAFVVGAEGAAQKQGLRARALEATAQSDMPGRPGVGFVPEWGRNRMRGMLESRPDWCVSRQRAWGLPIPAFVMPDGRAFMTAASARAVAKVVSEKGSDAWFQLSPEQLLAGYDVARDPQAAGVLGGATGGVAWEPTKLRKGVDILDVWFESGCSWFSVLHQRGLGERSELYLEGSDQHRGWFQVSLLPALAVMGQPPYKLLFTHGFMVDKDGKKLSKSRPDAARYEVDSLAGEFGVDVMRWWVSSVAYENDVKVDLDFFAVAGESYRKVRNTLRYLLSNLDDYEPAAGGSAAGGSAGGAEAWRGVPAESIDAWLLGRFDAMRAEVLSSFGRYDFAGAHKAMFDFCNTTLSAEYLAAVKDRLYCDPAGSARRRRTQGVLWTVADGLCRLLAPILCHTADEAYRALWKAGPSDPRCVHLELFPPATGVVASARWEKVGELLRGAQVAMERAKASMGVDNPLDMGVELPGGGAGEAGLFAGFDATDLADWLGVSRVTMVEGTAAPRVIDLRAEPRCERSWKRDGTVRVRSDGGMLSDRDAAAVGVA